MYLEQFLEDFIKYKNYSENTANAYRNRLLFLSKEEKRLALPIYKWDVTQITNVIENMSTNRVVIRSIPGLITSYLDWLRTKGINIEEGLSVLSSIDLSKIAKSTRHYFYSEKQLLAKIQSDSKYVAGKTGRTATDYRMVAAILFLSWYGLKIPEILRYPKSNIKENGIVIRARGTPIIKSVLDVLKECGDAIGYTQINAYTVCFVKYRETKYLLRTAERMSMSERTARSLVSRFNAQLSKNSEPYKIEHVYWSGIFFRAYQQEISLGGFPKNMTGESKIKFFGDVFSEKYTNVKQVNVRIKEYNLYTSIFRK